MAAAIALRRDCDSGLLRELAKQSEDADQVRRLLALAVVYDGGSRSDGARVSSDNQDGCRIASSRNAAETAPIASSPCSRCIICISIVGGPHPAITVTASKRLTLAGRRGQSPEPRRGRRRREIEAGARPGSH
jgi:hypothetical protein